MAWNVPNWLLPTIIGLIGGAIISGLISWFFAWESSRQLTMTHKQIVLLLRALESADVIKLRRNECGEATGVVIKLSGTSVGTSHDSATVLTVGQRKEGPSDTTSNDGGSA